MLSFLDEVGQYRRLCEAGSLYINDRPFSMCEYKK
jgi:hypothetical protein